MRFRFCGDLDCPDWVLAEIQTLSKLSSIKFKLLCTQVTTAFLQDVELNTDKIEKLCADAKFEWRDTQAAIAALRFVYTSAAKHSVQVEELSNETQQLGLPKEHATALCKVYSDTATAIRDHLSSKSLKLNSLEKVEWRVDYILSSSMQPEVKKPEVHMQLAVKDADSQQITPLEFTMDPDRCRLLLRELKQAEKIMADVGGSTST
jgi:hypothetical protein